MPDPDPVPSSVPPATLPVRDHHFLPEKDINEKQYFPEEFVYKAEKKGDLILNVPCNYDRDMECLSEVVGNPFNHADCHLSSYSFDRYIRLLIDQIRKYNRALYRLRRAHIFYEFPNDVCKMDELKDEDASLKLPVLKKDPVSDKIFHDIEKTFTEACNDLKFFLLPFKDYADPNHKGMCLSFEGNVDCIRVNDYIISIRVGGLAIGPTCKPGEIEFSSSSHISISSAFSSSR